MAVDFGQPVAAGEFGADMKVSLVNDGPVTIIIDSKNPEDVYKRQDLLFQPRGKNHRFEGRADF